jgi:NAD(P)-dependent dehydrogenase (short-subunit alcohol dehydrogenase family)
MTTLSGRVAIVTGGSRGIGFAVAQLLRRRGANAVITGATESVLAAARELEQERGEGAVMPVRADVRSFEQMQQVMKDTVSRFGGLDLLVNNAGVGIWKPVADMSVDEWHQVLDTNLTGVFHCCHAALPHLRARGGGWIINISSLAGTNPFPGAAAYCATKAGLNAFSEALMQEVRHEGIRVACIAPGSVRTGFAGRTAAEGDWKLAPEDVAEVVGDLVAHPPRSLPSRVEIRPSRPPKKG